MNRRARILAPLAGGLVLAVAAAAAFGGAARASGTAASAHMGGTLTIVASSDQGTMDPAVNYTLQYWQLDRGLYDGLVAFKQVPGAAGFQIVPDLATSIPKPTAGGKVWTFHVRRGIKYSNGATVKASDFRHVFERMYAANGPTTGTFYSGFVGASACASKPKTCNLSKGIVTNDDAGTVTFKLTAADPEFLDKLALPFAVAVPPTAPLKDANITPLPGTGSYMIKSYDPHTAMVMVRNPHFHVWSKDAQPQGYPDQIIEKFGLTNEAMVTQVENGQADYYGDQQLPADRLNEVATKYSKQVHVNPLTADYYEALNVRIPPFNNLKARQAVNYAVDRSQLVKIYGGPNLASPTCQVLPAGFPAYKAYCPYTKNPSLGRWTAPDMAKAKQLMAQSGQKGQKVSVIATNDVVGKAIGTYFQSLLSQLGFKATLKVLAVGPQYTYVQNSKNNPQFSYSQWYQDYPAASDFLNVLLGCSGFHPNSSASPNLSEFCDPAIQKQMDRAHRLAVESPTAANALYTKVDHEMVDKAVWVPLFNPKYVDFVSKRVGNYQFNDQYYMIVDQLWVK